jgi:hypothetical protein
MNLPQPGAGHIHVHNGSPFIAPSFGLSSHPCNVCGDPTHTLLDCPYNTSGGGVTRHGSDGSRRGGGGSRRGGGGSRRGGGGSRHSGYSRGGGSRHSGGSRTQNPPSYGLGAAAGIAMHLPTPAPASASLPASTGAFFVVCSICHNLCSSSHSIVSGNTSGPCSCCGKPGQFLMYPM